MFGTVVSHLQILDDVYMKNFMEAEEQQAAGNDAAHHSDAHGAGAGQFFGSGPPGPMRRVRGGPPGGRFGPMGPMMGRGGRGHMGPMGGRGGGPRGGYGGGMPMIPPMAGQVGFGLGMKTV